MDSTPPSPHSMIPAVQHATPRFLSFPGEIRNEIYRLLFCLPEKIGNMYDDGRNSSAQFLRTCRTVHDEAMPILYGENTFEFAVSNTGGPYYSAFNWPSPLHHYFPEASSDKSFTFIAYMRRFHVTVRYTTSHRVAPVRDAVRQELVPWLKQVLSIDSLFLDCQLGCDDDYQGSYHDLFWGSYQIEDNETEEVLGVLKTWCGRLRNVKTLKIDGILSQDARFLQERCQSSESLDKTPLTDMYTALEKHAQGKGFLESRLRNALLACEGDICGTTDLY